MIEGSRWAICRRRVARLAGTTLAVAVALVLPTVASAACDVSIVNGSVGASSFVVSGSTATYTPTVSGNLGANAIETELATHDVVIGTSCGDSAPGNITIGGAGGTASGIGQTSTHTLTFSPGSAGQTIVADAPTQASAFLGAFTGSLFLGGPVVFQGATELNQGVASGHLPIESAGAVFTGPVTIAAPAVIGLGGGVFVGSVDSATSTAEPLTTNSAEFVGAVGATNPLSTLSSSSTTAFGSITTTGNLSTGPLDPVGSTALTVTGTGSLTTGAITGSGSATISDATGTVTIGSAGTLTTLGNPQGGIGSLSATGAEIDVGGSVVTSGAQSYTGPVKVIANLPSPSRVFFDSLQSNVAFSSTIDSQFPENISVLAPSGSSPPQGNVTLGGAIGSTGPPGSFGASGQNVTIAAPSITTSGAQGYGAFPPGLVTLTSDLSISASGTEFDSPPNAAAGTTSANAKGLTIASGSLTLLGSAGTTNPLESLTVSSATATTTIGHELVGSSIDTYGAQTYDGPVSLNSDTTFAPNFGNHLPTDGVTFNGTIDGPSVSTAALLFGTAAAPIAINGAIGSQTPLSGVTIPAADTSATIGADITTTGDQDYGTSTGVTSAGKVTLTGDATLTSQTGNLNLSAIQGAHALTLDVPTAGKQALFTGGIGTVTPLSSLTVNAVTTLPVGDATVTLPEIETTGDQTFNDPVTVPSGAGTVDVFSTAGSLTFASTIDAASTTAPSVLDAFGATAVHYEAAIGANLPIGGLTPIAPGGFPLTETLDGGPLTTKSGATLSPFTLQSDYTVSSGTGVLLTTVGADSLDTHTLTVNGGITMRGSASGTGGIVKNGTASMGVFNAQSYTGPTVVNGGTVGPDLTVATSDAGNLLPPDSAFVLANDPSVSLALNFDHCGMSPTHPCNEAIGSLAGGGATGGGVALGPFTLTTGNDNTSTTYGGAITGTGSLEKVGTGTMTLTGSNAAATDVGGGAIDDEGTLGAVTLDGGTLSGDGTAGAVTQGATAGTIAPGTAAAIGELHTGALTLGGSSTLALRLGGSGGSTAGTDFDALSASGDVTLGSAALALTVPSDATPPIGVPLVVIANGGADPVSGTFAGAPEGAIVAAGALRFAVSYVGGDGNDVTLTRVLATPSLALSATDGTLTIGVIAAPPETAVPTGTVTFFDGATPLGSSTLDATGAATLTIAPLAPGTHSFTAQYSGDVTFAAATAAPQSLTIPLILPPPPLPPATAPVLGKVTQSHTTWALGSRRATIAKAKAKRSPVGTTFTFTLNETASVTLAFTQKTTGRRSGGRCVKETSHNRKAKSCSLSVAFPALKLTGHSGTDKVTFQGRLSSATKLHAGHYRVAISASADGLTSKTRTLTFTIASH